MKKSPELTAYLCGPITGLPNLNLGSFYTARKNVEKLGYNTILPHDLFHGIDTSDYEHKDYMRRCLQALLTTDIIVLLPGWENSVGAKMEIVVAELMNIPKVPIRELNELIQTKPTKAAWWERLERFQIWFDTKYAWFFSPAKNYKNQTLDR